MAGEKEADQDYLSTLDLHSPSVAIVVPVLNELNSIDNCLQHLLEQHHFTDIVIVDGGSTDGTLAVLAGYANNPRISLVSSQPGRGRQMNAGAAACQSDAILFLHADTRLPNNAITPVRNVITAGAEWGRFNVRINDASFLLSIVAFMMNVRSCITGICTGDQAIFTRRDVFAMLGGYSMMPLMEDIEFCRRLKRIARPACIRAKAITSARRWQRHGTIRTILKMWYLRLLYWLGVSPSRLVRCYRDAR
jgi:rSAM/selenodomain-associated transferase 2